MNRRLYFRRFLLICITLYLLVLAWGALAGGVHQYPHSFTVGQQIQTVLQLVCGLLSLMIVPTCFWMRKWAPKIRVAWVISLVTAAGLSSMVWGLPMPLIALVFVAVAFLVGMGTIGALKRLTGDFINTDK